MRRAVTFALLDSLCALLELFFLLLLLVRLPTLLLFCAPLCFTWKKSGVIENNMERSNGAFCVPAANLAAFSAFFCAFFCTMGI